MDDNKCQHEPVGRALYQRKPENSYYCEECCCNVNPIKDEARGEILCSSCGILFEEKLYDTLDPSTHVNTSEFNSGRDILDTSRMAFENKDHSGNPLSSERRGKFTRLRKYQNNIDRQKHTENNNKTVEKTLQELKRLNSTLTKAKENEYRKLLNNLLKSNFDMKNDLYKSGSSFNAIACALVLDSNCDLITFYDMLKKHTKSGRISSENRTAIIKRSKEIRMILRKYTALVDIKRKLAPVYPHQRELNVSATYQNFISEWWSKKAPIVRNYTNPPRYIEIERLCYSVLDNPDILKLKGGELIESVLDACLLISIIRRGTQKSFGDIAEELSLRPASRRYHRPLKRYISKGF